MIIDQATVQLRLLVASSGRTDDAMKISVSWKL